MNLLYLAHRIPFPPVKGDKIRSFNQIKHLSRTHTIHLACLVDERADWDHIRALEKWCASVEAVYRNVLLQKARAALGIFTSRPLTANALYSAELQQLIDKRLVSERIDRIVLSSSGMAEYVKGIHGIPRIMDFVDVDSEKWRIYVTHHRGLSKAVYKLEAGRLAGYEDEIARTFDHCLVVSEDEAKVLRDRIPSCPVSVVPNGVDFDWFNLQTTTDVREARPTLIFTGSMDYAPNIDGVRYFCSEVLPLISKRIPAVQFWIVGRNPTTAVKALADDPRVTVTSTVPDVRPYLRKAWVAVAPLRIARGLQNKVLEAMAMQLPVVGTSAAFRGTMATTADGISIADHPAGMAEETVTLLEDSRRRQQAGERARRFVERHHRWEEQVERLGRILEEVTVRGDH